MEIVCDNKLCGKVFEWKGGPAHFARCETHYCSRSCQNTTHGLAGTKRHSMWEGSKKRAKQNGTPFTLTLEDIPEIPERCPVLDIPVVANTIAGPLDSSPSLDRIIPELGYVPGNVRIISNRANRLRGDGTAEELRKIADDAERMVAV